MSQPEIAPSFYGSYILPDRARYLKISETTSITIILEKSSILNFLNTGFVFIYTILSKQTYWIALAHNLIMFEALGVYNLVVVFTKSLPCFVKDIRSYQKNFHEIENFSFGILPSMNLQRVKKISSGISYRNLFYSRFICVRY